MNGKNRWIAYIYVYNIFVGRICVYIVYMYYIPIICIETVVSNSRMSLIYLSYYIVYKAGQWVLLLLLLLCAFVRWYIRLYIYICLCVYAPSESTIFVYCQFSIRTGRPNGIRLAKIRYSSTRSQRDDGVRPADDARFTASFKRIISVNTRWCKRFVLMNDVTAMYNNIISIIISTYIYIYVCTRLPPFHAMNSCPPGTRYMRVIADSDAHLVVFIYIYACIM
jgi:hypothetical protein